MRNRMAYIILYFILNIRIKYFIITIVNTGGYYDDQKSKQILTREGSEQS